MRFLRITAPLTTGFGYFVPRLAAAALLAATITSASAEGVGPLVIAKQGHFFIGGKYVDTPSGLVMAGHAYVEYQIPCGQKMGTVGRTCSWASEVTEAPDVAQRVASVFLDLPIAAAESVFRSPWTCGHAAS